MNGYRVALDVYNGPLDLLLFLIRREEVDVYDIPIARVTEQYLAYVELLNQLDPEAASEFLVLAATLMELKSRTLLPRPPVEEGDDQIPDPRAELVRQLLAYKTFKDAAYGLEAAADEQAQRYARNPSLTLPQEDEVELDNIEIWTLFEAFQRLLEQTGKARPAHEVRVDDTPIRLHAADIADSLERAGGTQPFEDIFTGRSKAEMIGLFLALLELIRERRVRVSQDRPFDTILIHLLDAAPLGDVPDVVPSDAVAKEEPSSSQVSPPGTEVEGVAPPVVQQKEASADEGKSPGLEDQGAEDTVSETSHDAQ